jgi:hypothetical protein
MDENNVDTIIYFIVVVCCIVVFITLFILSIASDYDTPLSKRIVKGLIYGLCFGQPGISAFIVFGIMIIWPLGKLMEWADKP